MRQSQLFLGVTYRLLRQRTTCARCSLDHNHSVCVLSLVTVPAVPQLLSLANSTNTNPNNSNNTGRKAAAKTTAEKRRRRHQGSGTRYHWIPEPVEKEPTLLLRLAYQVLI